MCLIPKYKNKTELFLEISDVLKDEKSFREEKFQIIKAIINLEIKNLIPKEEQKFFEGDENMNEELGEIMIQAAKDVNKKYEQRALEKAKEEGLKEGKEEGLKEGKEEGLKEIAKKLKEMHTPEEISKITGLTLQTVLLL
jgi:flagellar biosynthesis/type III secretory pathway protein FliH